MSSSWDSPQGIYLVDPCDFPGPWTQIRFFGSFLHLSNVCSKAVSEKPETFGGVLTGRTTSGILGRARHSSQSPRKNRRAPKRSSLNTSIGSTQGSSTLSVRGGLRRESTYSVEENSKASLSTLGSELQIGEHMVLHWGWLWAFRSATSHFVLHPLHICLAPMTGRNPPLPSFL